MIAKKQRFVLPCAVLAVLFAGLNPMASIQGQALDPQLYGRLTSMDRSDRIELPGLEFIRKEIRANTFIPSAPSHS